MPRNAVTAAVLYMLSCGMDAIDGYVARLFKQSSKFGAVLDMVTDRCATAVLMVHLAQLYPQYLFVFQALIAIDLASHYAHMYSCMITGTVDHKHVRKTYNWFVRFYYDNRAFLFWLCAANESFWVAMFLDGPRSSVSGSKWLHLNAAGHKLGVW